MFKTIKNRAIIVKIARWIVLLAVIAVLFFQLRNFDWQEAKKIKLQNLSFLLFAVLLVLVNWFLEWKKWIVGMKSIGNFDETILRKGFYAGMLAGFLTPSALGNFLGRISAFHPQWKNKITTTTFFGNFSQFITSIFFGISSLFFIPNLGQMKPSTLGFMGLMLLVILLLFSYFFIDKVSIWKRFLIRKFPTIAEVSMALRGKLLMYSALRFLVFSCQFYLIIKSFQIEISFYILLWIWQLYLWTTLSPSLFLGKLFIRETLAVYILTFGGVELPIALLSSVVIWMINNVFPSIFAFVKWRKYDLVQG